MWKHFFTARLARLAFSSTNCRSKHLLLLSSCTSYQKAYRLSLLFLSMPSAIYLLIRNQLSLHEFTLHPYLLCDVSAWVSIQHETRLKHIFPRPAPFYFSLANNVSLRKGELSSHHIIGRRTHELSSDMIRLFFLI